MSYIRSWALGGDGIIFHRLSFILFFNRTHFWYNCTPKKSFLLWKKESIRTIIPQESDPGWAKSAGNKHQQKPTSLIYEDSSGFTLALLPQAKIPEASAGWAKSKLCGRNAHQPAKKRKKEKMSPSSWSAAHKPLPATLLHLSSVPCLKFVMREKVIFTAGCVRDLFKAFVRGSLSMQLLRLSAATESKGNTVDAVIARRCPQKELSLNWISLSPSVGEKQNLLLVLC